MTPPRKKSRFVSLPLTFRCHLLEFLLAPAELAQVIGETWLLHALGYESEKCERVSLNLALSVLSRERLQRLDALEVVDLTDEVVRLKFYGLVHQTADQLADQRAAERARKAGDPPPIEPEPDPEAKDASLESANTAQGHDSIPAQKRRAEKSSSPHVGGGTSGRGIRTDPGFVKRYPELVEALRSRRVSGTSRDNFYIACPAHHGDGDSCHVTIRDGRVDVFCHNPTCNAEYDAIGAALGFKNGDFFEREVDRPSRPSKWQKYEIRSVEDHLVAIQKRLDFLNQDGAPAKKFGWYRPDGTKGLGDLRQEDLPFFGSEKLGQTRSGPLPIIVVVEGTKKALRLEAFLPPGYLVLGTVTGGGSPHSIEVCGTLRGFEVLVWPDNDEQGIKNARGLAVNLRASGVARLSFVGPTGQPGSGDDCHDFIDENPDTATERLVALFGVAQPSLGTDDLLGVEGEP